MLRFGHRAVTLAQRNQARRFLLAAAVIVCAALFFVLRGAAVEPIVALAAQAAGAASSGVLEVLEVRPNFFMIAGAGSNIGVQVGEDGVVVVDAGTAASAPAVVAAIKRITPKPIRYVIDTGPDVDHVGGNDVLSTAGDQFYPGTRAAGARQDALRSAASILAAEGVLRHMTKSAYRSTPAAPLVGLPTESFHYAKKFLYLNDEPIEVLHQPAAHTDSDVFVFFRRSDVVVAGDVIDTRRFPVIDVERGGSIQGEIAALERLSELAVASVPIVSREAGTIVIPGHGRLCDQFDVIEYRDMVTIIRDRVRDLVNAGRSLEQVKAAAPAKGYAGRYGNNGGDWTTEKFVEAVYRSLMTEKGSGVIFGKVDGN
jgi:glyoxylase-like metal-dependent hydrolase (beta-lactamase superfamily II)